MTVPPNHRIGWLGHSIDPRKHRWGITYAPAALPSSMDLRAWDDPIYDQEYGDCVANAEGGLAGNVARQQGIASPVRSVMYTYTWGRVADGFFPNDSGMYTGDAFKVMNQRGVCKYSTWPEYPNVSTMPSAAAEAEAPSYKVTQYTFISGAGQTLIDNFRASIASKFPVVTAGIIYPSFSGPVNGVIPMPSPTETPRGGHEWVLVGYNDASQWFIMRNSWGTGYGLSGYAYMPYAFVLAYCSEGATITGVVATTGPNMTTTTIVPNAASVSGGVNPTGTITVTAAYSGDANNAASNALETITLSPTPPPTPGTSWSIPPAASPQTDLAGNAWTLTTQAASGGFVILCNGTSAAGGSAVLIEMVASGQVYVQNSGNQWYTPVMTGSTCTGWRVASHP